MEADYVVFAGKCKRCGQPVDNAVEGFITDAEGAVFHCACYGHSVVTASSKGRTLRKPMKEKKEIEG